MKAVIKKVLRSKAMLYFAAILLKIWIGFVFLSCRKIVVGQPHADMMQNTKDTFILTMWHRNLLMAPKTLVSSKSYASLSSNHPDSKIGIIYARLTGATPVIGSGTGSASKRPIKNKNGAAAFRSLIRHLNNHICVWLTADIPPGPSCECGQGIIALARFSQKPIMPTAIRTQNEIIVEKAWDKFIIPKPFGKLVIAYGEPIHVPRHADDEMIETYRLKLEKNLNDLHEKAENLLKGY